MVKALFLATRVGLILRLCVLVAITLAAYSGSLSGPFQFDDQGNIADNPFIRDPGAILRALTPEEEALGYRELRYEMLYRRVLGLQSFALNYRLHGLEPWGYHATNLAIHIAASLAFYFLLTALLRTPLLVRSALAAHGPKVAFCAALLFATHPVQTQAVTYIVQRFASMGALWYLLTMALYVQAGLSTGRARTWFMAGAFVVATLGMLTKEFCFTLPVALVMLERLFFDRPWRDACARALPFVPLTALVPLAALIPMIELGSKAVDAITLPVLDERIGRLEYLYTQARVLVTYLRLLVLPINQSVDYVYPVYKSALAVPVVASVMFHATLVGGAVWAHARYRHRHPALSIVLFGVLFFYLALSVESSLIPLDVIFEHRLYLPSAGIIAAIVAGGFAFSVNRWGAQGAHALALVMIALAMVLAVTTFERNKVWASHEALWSDAVRKFPTNARALNNLAMAYMQQGRLDEARALLDHAIELRPRVGTLRTGLAIVCIELDDMPCAQGALASSLALNPNSAMAHFTSGVYYDKLGDTKAAARAYEKAASIAPSNISAQYNLGLNYMQQGRTELGIEQFKKALVLNPAASDVSISLAEAYYWQGRRLEATRVLERAVALDPGNKSLLDNLAIINN